MFFFSQINDFSDYGNDKNIEKSLSPVKKWQYGQNATVFLSHKHSELNLVNYLIGFFEKKYDVSVYIDSNDDSMPLFTSGETAARIKRKIRNCKKFIFLATEESVRSCWCNWEIGLGDARKYRKDFAIFPIHTKNDNYTGNEFLQIYPYIIPPKGAGYDGDYRVVYPQMGTETPLREWFNV